MGPKDLGIVLFFEKIMVCDPGKMEHQTAGRQQDLLPIYIAATLPTGNVVDGKIHPPLLPDRVIVPVTQGLQTAGIDPHVTVMYLFCAEFQTGHIITPQI